MQRKVSFLINCFAAGPRRSFLQRPLEMLNKQIRLDQDFQIIVNKKEVNYSNSN